MNALARGGSYTGKAKSTALFGKLRAGSRRYNGTMEFSRKVSGRGALSRLGRVQAVGSLDGRSEFLHSIGWGNSN